MLMDTLQYAFKDASTRSLLEGIVRCGKLDDRCLTLIPLSSSTDSVARTRDQSAGAHPALRGLVDGAIVHSLPDNHPALMTLRASNTPMVVVDAPELPGVPMVGIRDREAAAQQLDHILELGHSRITIIVERLKPDGRKGFVGRERWANSVERVVRERIRGYESSCEAKGIDFQSVSIVEVGSFDADSARTTAGQVIDDHAPTAIVATSDAMALGALAAAAERHLRVPEDLSVIGFDDAPEAVATGLTTIRQPMVEKGEIAAALLLELLAGLEVDAETILPTSLIIRKTTGAPRVSKSGDSTRPHR
jgi:DNA-binding LacI/PurR family transcriptional regulator